MTLDFPVAASAREWRSVHALVLAGYLAKQSLNLLGDCYGSLVMPPNPSRSSGAPQSHGPFYSAARRFVRLGVQVNGENRGYPFFGDAQVRVVEIYLPTEGGG